MFNTVNEALENAKRHGLSTAEVLEGYRNERKADKFCWHCEDVIIGASVEEDGELFHPLCLENYHEKQYEAVYSNWPNNCTCNGDFCRECLQRRAEARR